MADVRRLTLEQVAAFPRPGTAVPQRIRFTPDGAAVGYLMDDAGEGALSLWLADATTGRRSLVLGPERGAAAARSLDEELRRERARLLWEGVTSYAFAAAARPPVVMVPQGGSVLLGAAGALRALESAAGGAEYAVCADGRGVAFVRDGEVWVARAVGGGTGEGAQAQAAAVRLTQGSEPGRTHGQAEFVAQEELGRPGGFWISPDGLHVAFTETDVRHIPVHPITHLTDPTVWVEEQRYPFAGAANAAVRLGVVRVCGGAAAPLWLDVGNVRDAGGEGYLARVTWTPDGRVAALLLTRDQRYLEWRVYDPETGAWSRAWSDEADHWLNLTDDTRFLGSGEVLTSSERDGFRHLYLQPAGGGAPRALTAGEWEVTGLCAVDEARRRVYFTATEAGVLERHVYAAGLDGGGVRRLTREPGWHAAVFDPSCQVFADQWSSRARAPRTVVRRLSGEVVAVVHEDAGATAEALGLPAPEFLDVPGADGSPLHGALYRPLGGGGERLPLIVSVYGGPGSQSVGERWDLTVDLQAQYLAQQGFLVWKLDNRGTRHRGAAFERALHRRFGTVEVEDQVAAVRWLQAHRGADAGRTGVYGWSYGGYMTLMLLAKAPDVFAAGVAGAPVTDFAGYDTAYTERYMDLPSRNADGYREAAVRTHLGGLRGRLLIIHGMIDENVHFRHTARLVQSLVEAGKPFELAALPAARHGVRGAAQRLFVTRRTCAFFEEHLGAGG